MKIAVWRSEVVEVEGIERERGGSAAAREMRRVRLSLLSGGGGIVVAAMAPFSEIWGEGGGEGNRVRRNGYVGSRVCWGEEKWRLEWEFVV